MLTGPATAKPVEVKSEACDGLQAEVRVPLENVVPLVPEPFAVAVTKDAGGRQLAGVVILAARCGKVTVGGSARRTRQAALRARLQPRPAEGDSAARDPSFY